MKVDGAYQRPPFVFWGNKQNQKSINTDQSERVQLSSRHVPTLLPFFSGKQVDNAFINTGGYNFNGSKINYLA